MSQKKQQILILGGGFGEVYCALVLKRKSEHPKKPKYDRPISS
jgi:NADH dehydrogenase FAD-containing subunit